MKKTKMSAQNPLGNKSQTSLTENNTSWLAIILCQRQQWTWTTQYWFYNISNGSGAPQTADTHHQNRGVLCKRCGCQYIESQMQYSILLVELAQLSSAGSKQNCTPKLFIGDFKEKMETSQLTLSTEFIDREMWHKIYS